MFLNGLLVFVAASWHQNRKSYGQAFCKHKKQVLEDTLVIDAASLPDKAKTFVGEYNLKQLKPEEKAAFAKCVVVYIKCAKVNK